ncbi:biotin/lipoyl-binding protein [Loktanella salsilacus]|uniref:HlyD family efflux transporter periplasmic adaptor subunit n=1 Tax=Loktanella salsilacus TaxID=195913 RepID=UPI0030FB6758
MQQAVPRDTPLPPLREDLDIAPGAPLLNGAPSWVIYDPIRHRFFQVGQRTIQMLGAWSAGTAARLRARLATERAMQIGVDEVAALLHFLRISDLLADSAPGMAKGFDNRERAGRQSALTWMLHRYIFFRLPLVRPNGFLHATWPVVRPLFSRGFAVFTAVILVIALYLASRQSAEVLAQIRGAFSLNGALTYAAALVCIKILHELGHAYQAVSRGLRVPVMGVAFIVMFPLLYTDTTEAWRLRTRRGRVMVDLGGIMVELALAVHATLLWCFLPDGPVRDAVFAVATVSWLFSLLVNLNPLMRFDGYYLLADSLGIHNLQPRSFAMAKWALRRALFGLGDAAPETLSPRLRGFMVVYGYMVWIYRFFLFLSIALLVYALTFKALGIILFLAEIVFFIATPIWRELKVWFEMRERIIRTRRSWITLVVALSLAALTFVPLPGRIAVPALLDRADQQALYSSVAGRLVEVLVEDGQQVAAGDLLFVLENPEMPLRIQQARQRIALSEARLRAGAGDAVERAARVVTASQLEQEREALSALLDRQSDMEVRAPLGGVIRDLASGLEPGTWLGRTQRLGRIVAPGDLVLKGYISEGDLTRMADTGVGTFIPDDPAMPKRDVDAILVRDFSIRRLPDAYLSAAHGGRIPVMQGDTDAQQPKGVWYPVMARTSGQVRDQDAISTGVLVLRSQPMSFASKVFRRISRVLIREADL